MRALVPRLWLLEINSCRLMASSKDKVRPQRGMRLLRPVGDAQSLPGQQEQQQQQQQQQPPTAVANFLEAQVEDDDVRNPGGSPERQGADGSQQQEPGGSEPELPGQAARWAGGDREEAGGLPGATPVESEDDDVVEDQDEVEEEDESEDMREPEDSPNRYEPGYEDGLQEDEDWPEDEYESEGEANSDEVKAEDGEDGSEDENGPEDEDGLEVDSHVPQVQGGMGARPRVFPQRPYPGAPQQPQLHFPQQHTQLERMTIDQLTNRMNELAALMTRSDPGQMAAIGQQMREVGNAMRAIAQRMRQNPPRQ
ncbi:hypothetical protein GE09DRAFT_1227610 [Coniochaeta sp. 2T2.1]|nr:hypothetical protein GE09DRAFT_1227610 [Coniochaeta sp. 2T2.1]